MTMVTSWILKFLLQFYISSQYTAISKQDLNFLTGNIFNHSLSTLKFLWLFFFSSYKGKIGWAPATCLKVADSISSHSANIPVEIVSNLSDVSKLLKGNDTTTDSPMAVSQRPKSTAETFTDFSSVSVEDSDNYEEVEESHYSRINSLYGNTSHTVLPPPRQNSVSFLF